MESPRYAGGARAPFANSGFGQPEPLSDRIVGLALGSAQHMRANVCSDRTDATPESKLLHDMTPSLILATIRAERSARSSAIERMSTDCRVTPLVNPRRHSTVNETLPRQPSLLDKFLEDLHKGLSSRRQVLSAKHQHTYHARDHRTDWHRSQQRLA